MQFLQCRLSRARHPQVCPLWQQKTPSSPRRCGWDGVVFVVMLSVGKGCRHSIVLLLQELLAARDDDALVVVAYNLTCEVEEAVVSLVALDVADAVSV